MVDGSVCGQCHVEFLKVGVEEQIEGVLEVFSLLFTFFSANKLNLSGVF
jgi:hypothetical protein